MLYSYHRKVNSKTVRTPVMQRKVLVIFPGTLGDFVCFLPALRGLAKDRIVDLLARTEYADLLSPGIRTRSLDCHEISRLFAPEAEGDERLQSFFESYETVWSWMGSGQPDFVKNLSVLSRGRLRVFPFQPVGARVHLVDYYRSCLGEAAEFDSLVQLQSDAVAWSDAFWKRNRLEQKKVLALAPGSGAREKNWPDESYKIVAEWWEKELGGRVVVVIGPVEEEKGNIVDVWGSMLTARRLRLMHVAALLARCDLYLGNDSGVTHLSAALGVPTVALFGPTDPVQWAPRGESVAIVTQTVECSPCVLPVMKACPHRKCLTTLSPEDIIKVVRSVLEKLDHPS